MASDDEANPLGPAVRLVRAAVDLGGRASDAGDADGAYGLLACAARLVRKVRGLSEVADFRLERALDEAEADADAIVLSEAFESLLPDDDEPGSVPDEPLAAVQHFIQMAISIGAPAYNLDDKQGCFDVYAATARMILAAVNGADVARTRLRAALDECDKLDDPDKQAWALRHGFDAVLDLSGAAGPPLAATAIHVLLTAAVTVGAPAFNLGDARGCYETYACTARLLVHTASVPEAIRDRLRTALQEAAVLPEVARQAWVLRHAFDAILADGDPK